MSTDSFSDQCLMDYDKKRKKKKIHAVSSFEYALTSDAIMPFAHDSHPLLAERRAG